MYKRGRYKIRSNEPLTASVFRMVLEGDTQYIVRPGQFVNVAIDGFFLRRPISVCDWDGQTLTLVYKVVGEGTERMSEMRPGAVLDLLTGLGNGFEVGASTEKPLLVGGGVGVPPLYGLAKKLLAAGKKPVVLLGFNAAEDVFYEQEFRALGVETHVVVGGYVTEHLSLVIYHYFYACGPLAMLRALATATGDTPGELSFEERMGCGFGGCMGCSCQTKNGAKRICKEGPVLGKEEVLW